METTGWISVKKAAERLGVHPQAIRNAIADGRLVSAKVFDRDVVSEADLEEYRARTQPDGVKPRGRPKKVVK